MEIENMSGVCNNVRTTGIKGNALGKNQIEVVEKFMPKLVAAFVVLKVHHLTKTLYRVRTFNTRPEAEFYVISSLRPSQYKVTRILKKVDERPLTKS